MNYYFKLIIEALCVGLLVVIVGSLVGFMLSKVYPTPILDKSCKNYNKFFIMESSLFLTGFLVHLICEFFGVNKWYIKNGAVNFNM